MEFQLYFWAFWICWRELCGRPPQPLAAPWRRYTGAGPTPRPGMDPGVQEKKREMLLSHLRTHLSMCLVGIQIPLPTFLILLLIRNVFLLKKSITKNQCNHLANYPNPPMNKNQWQANIFDDSLPNSKPASSRRVRFGTIAMNRVQSVSSPYLFSRLCWPPVADSERL
jgi:hypothetical protein